MGKPSTWVAWSLMAFLYLPVITVVVFSFQGTPRLGLPFDGPSLRWFESIWADPGFRRALGASLRVALVSCLVSVLVSTLAALGLHHYRGRGAQFVSGVATLPIALPGLMVGLALLTYFTAMGLTPSLLTVTLAHVIYVIPYVLMVISSALQDLDSSIAEAARDLGANAWQAFWRTTFGLLWPAVLAGAVLAFALSFDEFLITLLVIGNESTLPVFVWSRMRRTIDPSVNAVASGLLLVVLIGVVVSFLLARLSARRTRRTHLHVRDEAPARGGTATPDTANLEKV